MVGRRGWGRVVAGSSLVSLLACSSGNSAGPGPEGGPGLSDDGGAMLVEGGGGSPDATATASQTIGATGGAVSTPGASLTVPAGALANPTTLTVTPTRIAVPPGYTGLSPVFSLGPAGTTFLVPATIDIAVTAPPPGATIYWSNAGGGYDPLPTTPVADGVSAPVDHLGNGFCGAKGGGAPDAATGGPTDSGPADSGEAAMDADQTDTGTTDSGPPDSSPSDSGTVDSSQSEAGTTDAGLADSGEADSGPSDSGGSSVADAGLSDAAVADASMPAIRATIDGAPVTFATNLVASPLQTWWALSADDSAAASHWTIRLVVPDSVAVLNCQGGSYPEVTYTHYTGVAGDAGVADMTYTTQSVTGAGCTIDETSAASVQGEHATGTFSGTLVLPGDAGSPASHTFTAGSYDVVVP